MRPCFVIDPRFLVLLTRFNNKEELIKPKSQCSVYQRGVNMMYCNPVPIAAGCCLEPKVVEGGLKAIFDAVYNLIALGKNIILKTGFCNICFNSRNLTYSFSPEIMNMIKDLPANEKKFVRGRTPINKIWNTKFKSKWGGSTLSSMLERPQDKMIRAIDNKSQMLKIMSIDMASTHLGKGGNYNYCRPSTVKIKTHK